MNRTEIRELIKEYLEANNVKNVSADVAEELGAYLRKKHPNKRYGNLYTVYCEFWEFFPDDHIDGRIDLCDPLETEKVICSVKFFIDKKLRVMTWENQPIALTLDVNNLTEDDLIDIENIDAYGKIDIYYTFMRTPAKDRGKLAAMIPGSLALELFVTDIPPYAFYGYDGLFYHRTNKAVGDIGGGFGFGGLVRELGTVATIGNGVVSVGDHAFDGCRHLTEIRIASSVRYIGKHAFSNIPGLVIRCNMSSKPAMWDDEWCDENCTVYFEG